MNRFGYIIALALLIGCDDRAAIETAPAASSSVASTAPAVLGTAAIKGVVTFQGAPPTISPVPNFTCTDHAKPVTEESILVGSSAGLKNCLVYLEGTPAFPAPATPALLDQINCRYEPHVLAIQTNQPL